MAEQRFTLSGNLTGDPEVRFTRDGKAVAAFTVASNDRYLNAQGEWLDSDPLFQKAVVFGPVAEHMAASVAKGDRVTVAGRLVSREWETDAGERRYGVDMICDEIAVSLKWATCTVQRVRSSANGATADAWAGDGSTREPVAAGADAPAF